MLEEGILVRRPVTIAWQNKQDAVVSTGVSAGDLVVITPLGQVPSGTRARLQSNQRDVKGRTGIGQ